MSYTGNQPDKTDMFSTINIGIGCTMFGISQFIIGLVLNTKSSQAEKDDGFVKSGSIYFVIAGISAFAAILTYWRSLYVEK